MEFGKQSLLVAAGAAVGANARYWLSVWTANRFGTEIPWGTFAINVSGSFVIGLFLALSSRYGWAEGWRLLIAVGLAGGYTTFSAFSLELLNMLQKNLYPLAALYVLASVTLGLAACGLGVFVGGLQR